MRQLIMQEEDSFCDSAVDLCVQNEINLTHFTLFLFTK